MLINMSWLKEMERKEKDMFTGVVSVEKKGDAKFRGGWQPCLSFTGRSTCVTLIWVPKVGTGGLTTVHASQESPYIQICTLALLTQLVVQVGSCVWIMLITRQHAGDIIIDNLMSSHNGTHNPKMLKKWKPGRANFANAGHTKDFPALSHQLLSLQSSDAWRHKEEL